MSTTVQSPHSEQLQAVLLRGGELLSQGHLLEAQKQFETAYALAPDNERARSLLGLTYFKLGLVEQALGIYLTLVEQNPSDATLRVNLGLVYLKSGDYDLAIEQLTYATQLDPAHAKAQQYLAVAMSQRPQAEAMSAPEMPSAETFTDESTTDAYASTSPFLFGPDGLAVTIHGELSMRLDGLLAVVGSIQVRPEPRRYHGQPTAEVLGGPHSAVQHLTGQGMVYVEADQPDFEEFDWSWASPYRWGDAEAYVREECVFAFESSLDFESGQLNEGDRVLSFMRLGGAGRLLLRLQGTLKTIPLPTGTPMMILEDRLVGWTGFISPRMLSLGGREAVELSGEGIAFVRAPATRNA